MGHRKIGEMPEQVRVTKCFCRSLKRTCEIKHNTNDIKRKCVTIGDSIPFTLKSHQEIGGARHHRNEHAHASYNGYSLQRPGYSTENKMMGTNDCIEQNLG